MTKKKFLKKLERNLRGTEKNEKRRIMQYYEEMIDDSKEDGKNEEDAVAILGAPEEIAEREMNEIAERENDEKNAGKKTKTSRKGMPLWLIIVGSPLWFTLFILAVTLFIVIIVFGGALYLTCGALELILAVTGIACTIASFPLFFMNFPTGLFSLGIGATICGLTILIFPVLFTLTKSLGAGIGSLWRKAFKKGV